MSQTNYTPQQDYNEFKLLFPIVLIIPESDPLFQDICIMMPMEEFRIAILLERSPVTANGPVKGYDRLEYAAVVMRPVTMLLRQNNISAFIADEIFIVWRYEQVSSLAESTRPATIR